MKILFVSPEVAPFAKTGGLADVSGALPCALNDAKHSSSIIMPFYRLVRTNKFAPKLLKADLKLNLGNRTYSYNLLSLKHKNTTVYFIDNSQFYDREELYTTTQGDYPDNALRFASFAKAVLSALRYLGSFDIVHCNDWQSALLPLYLKLFYQDKPEHRNIKTVFTIHNLSYQGLFDLSIIPELDLPNELNTPEALEFYGKLNLMKAGIIYSDAVSTVSKGYAKEILTEEFGCGLDGLLRTRQSDLYGIINGADYDNWNPKTDKFIIKNYDSQNLQDKIECKKDLLKMFGLKFDEKKPVVGMITRLAAQKGLDIVADSMKGMLSQGVYFVLLGAGDQKYNDIFHKIAKQYKSSVGIKIAFDNSLAHKIEAGSDMFLMPSRFEPCGLNQMYSLKYATIPVVRATGGLDDTIENFNPKTKKGNGFKFIQASQQDLLKTLTQAIKVFKDKKLWRALQLNGMACDFSWGASAAEYIKLYKKILHGD